MDRPERYCRLSRVLSGNVYVIALDRHSVLIDNFRLLNLHLRRKSITRSWRGVS